MSRLALLYRALAQECQRLLIDCGTFLRIDRA